MTIRIREGNIAAVLLDDWYKVKLGSFQLDDIDFTGKPGTIEQKPVEGFIFTPADHENNMIAGPFKSIRAVRLVTDE
jgi:hypothetical protein